MVNVEAAERILQITYVFLELGEEEAERFARCLVRGEEEIREREKAARYSTHNINKREKRRGYSALLARQHSEKRV
jgi:hypothetical protein